MDSYAHQVATDFIGHKQIQIRKFPTGLSHHVYELASIDGSLYVIRIASRERSQEFVEGLAWHSRIAKLGVRLPQVFTVGQVGDHHFAIYERLAGDDLENCYASLTAAEKKRLAVEVAEIQQNIAALDRGLFHRFPTWDEVLQGIILRSEQEILDHNLCDPRYIECVRRKLEQEWETLQSFKPQAFLYDLNIRNVLIQHGKLTGIIDVDEVWYGDPLLAIGRGKTILLAMKQDTIFIDHWCEHLKFSAAELQRIEFYALLYCLRFMGTIGTKLNGNESLQTNPENARLFERLADQFLAGWDHPH